MEIRAAATLATSHLLTLPNHVCPSSFMRILSCSVAKPSVFLASVRAIRRPRCRMSSRARRFAGARMSVASPNSLLDVKKKATEILDDLRGTSIFLVGMNCTMKTDLGKVLADALMHYYFDTDSLVEQGAGGASDAKSLIQKDEKGFREIESEVLKQLSSMVRLVVCAGEGSVQTSTNLAYLRDGISVWVDVPLDYLANEVLNAEALSPITNPAPESDSFSKVIEELVQHYNKLKGGFASADTTVSLLRVACQLGYEDFISITPEDMALEALNGIEKLIRVRKMKEEARRPF